MSNNAMREWDHISKEQLLNFLAKKSKQATSPLSHTQLCIEFIEDSGTSRTRYAIDKQIRRGFYPLIPKLENFSKETKVRMLFALSVPLNENLLEELRKDAIVMIDGKRKIQKYCAFDGSLELEGDHSWSAKYKAGQVDKRRRSGIPEDRELKEYKEEALEETKKPSITKSGRVSKRKIDKFFDYSDKIQKSTSEISRFKNEERPAIENSTESSSSSTSRLHSYHADFSTGSHSIDTRADISHYSGSSFESMEYQEYENNIGETERKPSPSELLNILQNSEESRVDDVEFEMSHPSESHKDEKNEKSENSDGFHENQLVPENKSFSFAKVDIEGYERIESAFQPIRNSNELTNGKEFLKLLRNMVLALDSPKLLDLYEKIEKAIASFGDQNHKVPIDDILMILGPSLHMVIKSAKLALPPDESTSLRDLLLILRTTLFTVHSTEFNRFQQKIKTIIEELGDQDMKVSIEKVRLALESTLGMVTF